MGFINYKKMYKNGNFKLNFFYVLGKMKIFFLGRKVRRTRLMGHPLLGKLTVKDMKRPLYPRRATQQPSLKGKYVKSRARSPRNLREAREANDILKNLRPKNSI